MELRGSPRGGLVSKVALLVCVCLCVLSVLTVTAGKSNSGACLEITSWRTKSNSQGWRRRQPEEGETATAAARRRRRELMGPGSHPPQCAFRCGGCNPCWPVHVPVPPRAPANAAEYYPEAWRCKCGGRIYVP